MDDFYLIGQKIKSARKAMGMTQKELARKTDYTESGISRIEKGEIDLGVSKVKLFSDVLHVPVDYLIGDYFARKTETPEEMFDRLDEDVRHELIIEMFDLMKQKEAKKWQQQSGTVEGGGSGSASTVASVLSQIQPPDEEAEKQLRSVRESAAASLSSQPSPKHGADTSKR